MSKANLSHVAFVIALGILGLVSCAGITSDPEVARMDLRDSQGYYLDTVEVYRERGTGREYYFHNGVKEYVDTGPGTGLGTRGTVNRNR